MEDTYKFPGGNDVRVLRKQDVIKCIDENIVDKEVALAIVQQCEIDALTFLTQGRWVGIPYLGSIRPSQVDKLAKSAEQQELIAAAAETATPEQFCLFRRKLAVDNEKRVKAQRYYDYILSCAVNQNRALFKKLCREKGESYARIHFFLTHSIVAVSNTVEILEDV